MIAQECCRCVKTLKIHPPITLCHDCKEYCTDKFTKNHRLISDVLSKKGIRQSDCYYEDYYQELSIIFWKCLIKRDERTKFSTYIVKSMMLGFSTIMTRKNNCGFANVGRTKSGSLIWLEEKPESLTPMDEEKTKELCSNLRVVEDTIENESTKSVREAVSGLPERNAKVIMWHAFDKATLEECGRRLGICKERARQLEKEGMSMLRERLQGVAS